MTTSKFMDNFKIKNESLVLSWLKDDYIPGATKDEDTQIWTIPESARPPFTGARAKNTNAIYKSIVKACIQRKHVIPKLYEISKQEFDEYIRQLSDAGIIDIIEDGGVRYYYATTKSNEFIKSNNPNKFIKTIISTITEAATKGAITALMK